MAWEVKKDEDRDEWAFEPLVGVGGLSFGSPLTEVRLHLGAVPWQPAGASEWIVETEESFTELGVTLYADKTGRLMAVAVDALRGPQVRVAGMPVTGRVPSALDQWLCEYNQEHGFEPRYSPDGGPVSPELGLFIRAQRAGDVLLTRPIFLAPQWTRDVWDCMHSSEWRLGGYRA
ncbi:hypothetical protein AB0C86_35995 [Streptomyces lavendulae]|uniref:hypothetical protein n=1 Tax=Streptomyces lavendulae TaxID=1914 RepID=UPI0034100E6B